MAKLPNVSPELVKAYQEQIGKNSSAATLKRKQISLNRFFDWAQNQGHIDSNPLSQPKPVVENSNPYTIVTPAKKKNPRVFMTLTLTGALIVVLFLLTWKLQFAIPFTITPAAESVPNTRVQTVTVNPAAPSPSSSPIAISANTAVNSYWNLFAKLTLTDSNGSPRVGTETLSFKLYNQSAGGAELYSSPAQQIKTDANGSALISLDQVPTDLFFKNDKLFLEPSIGSSSGVMRIPVNTANTSTNLNGYLAAEPSVGAGPLTVPIINSDGALMLAGESPAIKAKTGNFLMEGQAVTIKTADGSDGNIEVNPDGKGYVHFLFEANKGDLLNVQGPNLTSGSLYYGMVPNNSTGYYLMNLQSGSPKMTSKFTIDAVGNTFTAGDLTVGDDLLVKNDISTGGVQRLTGAGALENITGYSQNSGNFTINQGAGEYASIVKKPATGGALNDLMTLTLDERGKPTTANSSYSTLVLNRYDGWNDAAALKVNTGNAIFNGQLQLGRFTTNPSAIGEGSIVYNSGDDKIYYWDGATWVLVATGTSSFSGSFADLTSGTNTAAAMVVGTGSSLTFSGTGTITASEITCTGCVANSELANNSITFAGDSGSSAVALGGTQTIAGSNGITTSQSGSTLTVTGSNATTSTVGVASFDPNFFTVSSGNVSVANDSFDFAQLKDNLTLDANTDIATAGLTLSTSGTGEISLNSTGQVTIAGNVDATSGVDVTGANLTVGGANFSVNVANGNTTTAGDLAVNGGDITSTSGTFNLLNSGVTALNIGGGATSLSLGAGTGSTTINNNLVVSGTTTFGGIPYTWPGSQSSGYILQTDGAGALSWVDPSAAAAASIFWTQTNGALFPKNNSVDVLIGSNATSSAKFAFTGVNGGTPTASIAGSVANVATYLTGNGNLATTNMSDLTLGGSTTGNININSRGVAALTANGANLTTVGTFTFPNTNTITGVSNFLRLSQGVSVGGSDTYNFSASGDLNANAGTFGGDVAVNGGDLTTSASSATLFNTNATTINFAGAANTLNIGPNGGAGVITLSGGSGDTGCTLDGSSGNFTCSGSITSLATSGTQGWWQLNNKVLSPANSTYDLTVGGSATGSAFQVFGVEKTTGNLAKITSGVITSGNVFEATASAITSGNIIKLGEGGNQNFTGNGIYADFDNTGGGSFTGNFLRFDNAGATNFLVDASGNVTAAGDVAVNGGDLTTTQTTGNLFTNASTLGIGAGSGTTTVNNALAVNGSSITTDETSFSLINTNSTTVNFAGAATAINIGAISGTTTLNNSLLVKGDTTLGDAITDGISFVGRVNTNVLPITNNTYDLGSGALQWANIYGTNLYQNGNAVCDITGSGCPASSSVNYWQLNNKVLSPANITHDLAVGGTATTSAKFQAYALETSGGNLATLNSTGITTGNVLSATSSAITSGNLVKLGEGGDQNFTGNGIYADFDNTGGGSFTGNFVKFDNAGNTRFTVGANGDITTTGVVNLPNSITLTGVANYLQSSAGFSVGGATTYYFDGSGNINANAGTFAGDVAVNGADLTTSSTGTATLFNSNATTLNVGGAATVVNLGAASGTTTVNNALVVNGDTTLGNAITDTITFTGRVAQDNDLIPITTTGTNDLGSSSLPWDNVYADAFVQNGFNVCDSSGANCPVNATYWQLNNKIISPSISSYDLAIGGTATGSAFQVFGIENTDGDIAKLNSTVITTGNVFEATASAITSGNIIKLGTGGDSGNFTGNGIFLDFDNAGGSSFTGNFLRFDNAGSTRFTVDASGNMTAAGDVAANSGNLTTTSSTANVFNTNATALNIGAAATTISIGNTSGTTTINNASTVVAGNLTVQGTTGITESGTGADITFSGSGTHSITNSNSASVFTIDSGNAANLQLNNSSTGDVEIAGGSGTTGCTIANATGNLTCSGDVAVNGGDLTTTQTTANLFTNATTLGIGAGSGTTTVNNTLSVNGGTLTTNQTSFNLVNSTATTINFAGAATTLNIGPTGSSGTVVISGGSGDTGCTLDGTTGNFTCSGNITSTATSGTQGWWQLANKVLSPANSTYDLTVGGSATGSAFQVFGIENTGGDIAKLNSTVITTGNVFEATASAITTGNLVKLGTGGDGHSFSGNAIFADLDNAGGGNFTGNFLRFDNSGSTVFTVDSNGNLTSAGDVAVNGGDLTTNQTTANVFLNATTLGLGAGSGTTTVNNALSVTGSTNLNGDSVFGNAITDTITFTGRVAQDSDLIPITTTGTNDLGSGSLPWDNVYADAFVQNGNAVCDASGANCPAGAGYWNQSLGALFPTNNSTDLLIGGNATTSAKFAFTNVASGVPTATIAGSVANVATYLTGNGNLATTNMSDLTLGGSTTGNVVINSRGSAALTANGANLTATGTFTLPNSNTLTGVSGYIQNSAGYSVGGGTTYRFDGSGNIVANDIAANGGNITTTAGTANLLNTNATTINFAGAATTLNIGPTGSSGLVAISGGSGDTGCTLDGTTGNFTCSGNITSTATSGTQGWWQLANKVLSPANSTYDLTVGSNATGAAFQVFGIENAGGDIAKLNSSAITTGNVFEATASAITTGNLVKLGTGGDGHAFSGNGIFMDFDNAGGGNFTGNFLRFDNSGSTVFTVDSSGNVTAAGDVAVNGGDLTTSQTTANIFTNASTLGIGAGSGTTTVNNGLSVTGNTTLNGDSTLGNAITDTITFTGRVAQDVDLIPITTTGTNDLGSGSLPWDNIYGVNLFQNGNAVCDASGNNCPAGAGYWAQALGALYNVNNTVDLLVGSNATSSAKFAFINVASGVPTASVSGSVADVATYLTGNGNLATTNMSDLTLGGSETGNVVINSRGSVALTANGANLTATGTFTLPNSNSLTGVSGYLQNSAGYSVGGGTTFHFDSSGNIVASDVAVNGGDITSSGALNITPTGALVAGVTTQPITLQGSTASLTSNGAGNDISLTSADQIILNAGTSVEIVDNTNITGDLDVSGTLTSGTGNAFQVDANGNLSSTGTTGLTLTGADSDITFATGASNHDITATAGTLRLGAFTLLGAITGNNQNVTGLGDLSVNGNTTLGDAITDTITFTGRVAQDVDLIPITTTGTNDLGSASLPWDNVYGVAFTQNGFGVCDASGNNCPAGSLYWQLNNKIISPANSTYDLTIGGTATGSAFQVFGVETASGDIAKLNSTVITSGNVFEATASAITTGNLVKLGTGGDNGNFTGNGIFMDFDNTGGSSFTGNFLRFDNAGATQFTVNSAGNISTLGDAAINGGDITSSGALNITPGGALVIGATGQTTTLQGSVVNVTANGAGNDLTLTSSDQVILVSGSTIELQDNTNVTGNLDISGTLTSGTGDAFQIDANGNISSTGTTGITLTGADSDFTFATGAGNHDITASSGTLRLGALTLTGAITGNNQNVTDLGDLSVNGNTTLGDAITDTITFTGRVAQDVDLIPITTTGTNDLGSGSLPWDNVYANAFTQNGFAVCDSSGANCPAGASHWALLNQTLYPSNQTYDVVVGGNSTSSAKFLAYGIENTNGGIAKLNSSVITTGNVFEATASAITTGNLVKLGSGGDGHAFSGNAIFADLDNAGGGNFSGNFLRFDNSGTTYYTVDSTGNVSLAGTTGQTFTGAAAGISFTGTGIHSISNSQSGSILRLDSGNSSALQLNNISAGDVEIAGGSASTGCTIANSTGNLTCTGDVAVNGGDLTTTQTTANLFTNASTLGIGAGSGTTTVNNALAVNGASITTDETSFSLLNATTTTLNFAGAATTLNIGPTGSGTASIVFEGGSGDTGCTMDGANGNLTCSGAITTTATSGTQGWWQLANKVLSPANSTYDLTVGGNATGSAFQVFGIENAIGDIAKINSTVVTTGNIFEATASAITSGNIIKLGQAGPANFTGNGLSFDFDNTGGGSFTGNFIYATNSLATMFIVDASGNVTANGDLAVNGSDITTTGSGPATIFNTNATSLSLGGAATTALNIGNGSGNYSAINIGSGNGDNTVNVATGTGNNSVNISTGGTGTNNVAIGGETGTTNLIVTSGSDTSDITTIYGLGLTSGNFLAMRSDDNRTAFAWNDQDTNIAGQKDQTQIANLTDTFVYDTTQDPDGGLWRNDERAKGSSWYNEASGATRGSRREFPEKAILVSTTTALYIYDAKDNSLWMEFDKGSGVTEQMIGATTSSTGSSTFGLNGKIYYTANSSSGALFVIDFKVDRAQKFNSTNDFYSDKNIANRNTTVTWTSGPSSPIADSAANDVHARTYRGKTYVAVATDTGVSVINETDNVVYSYSDATNDDYNTALISQTGDMYALNETSQQLERWNSVVTDSASELNGTPDNVWDETGVKIAGAGAVAGPYLFASAQTINVSPSDLAVTTGTSKIDGKSDTIFVGHNGGLTVIDDKKGDESNGSAKYYNSSYISEQMIGDIRGSWTFNGSGTIADNANATDVSVKGNVLDADNANGTGFTYASGVRGTGVTLDNTDDFFCSDANNDNTCDTDSDYDFGTGSFSVSTWFKHSVSAPPAAPNDDVIIDHTYNTTPAAVLGWKIWMNSAGTITFGIDDDATWTNADPTDDQATTSRTFLDNSWHHLVAVKDSTNAIYLYIDGELAASDVSLTATGTLTGTGVILGVGADCSTGAACATGANFWNGDLDELTITAEAMTVSQIKKMYQVGQRALSSHNASAIANVTADNYQRLMGNASGGTSTSNRVMSVGIDSGSQFIYAGINDASGNTGGVTVVGIDSDSAVDLYDNTANTTKDSDNSTQYSANDVISLSVAGFPCIAYNSGSSSCDTKATLSIAGIDGSGNNQAWMETTNTSLYSTLATLTSPNQTKNAVTVNNVFQVYNNYNNITNTTTGEVIQTPAMSVDSNGNFTYNYFGPSTSANAMTYTDSANLTTGDLFNIVASNALTTGNVIDINSAVYTQTAANTGSLVNLALSNTSSNTSGNSIVNGLNITGTLNTTGATGTKEFNMFNVSAPTLTGCTGGTCAYSGLKVSPASAGSGITEYGINIANLSGAGAGTETALSIGSGWDTDIALVDTSPIITIGDGGTLSLTDGTNTLAQLYDAGTAGVLGVSKNLLVGTVTGLTTRTFSRFSTADTTSDHALSTAGDVLINGNLEVDTGLYLDGKNIYNTNGTATIVLCTGQSGAACATTSALENTLSAGSWVIDNQSNVGEPALAVNNGKGGDLIVASAGGVLRFRVATNGDVFLGDNSGTDLTVGGGTGKIDVGTVDPPYTINGKKYATYLASMIGVKEEVSGSTQTTEYLPGVGYRTVIDFNAQPEGSDLWLFGKTTNMNENIGKLTALLTPNFPTKTWYEVDQSNKRVNIYSAMPAQISYRLTGPRFDAANWLNTRTEGVAGFIINNADIVTNFAENIQAARLGDFVIEKVSDGMGIATYSLKNASGQVIDGIESIGNFVAANIKTGALQAEEIATQTINATQISAQDMLISMGLIAPDFKTKLIAPLAEETDITVQIGSATESGRLAITNAQNEEVASISSTGDATFSGELYARNIHSENLDQIRDILTQVQEDQALLSESQNWNTSTSTASGSFGQLATADLYVTNQAALNSLSVTQTATIGNDLVIASTGINTLSEPLKIQDLALAPVEIMAGLVTIDTSGNVAIAGNLDVAGTVSTSTLAVKDISGNQVSSIDASGSATFASVNVSQIIVAGAQDATNSAVVNGEIHTNSTVGKGVLPANSADITIRNPKVNDYTFVYITPTSNTQNNVLYIKEKGNGYFKVGFTSPIPEDTNFNWWIVQTE